MWTVSGFSVIVLYLSARGLHVKAARPCLSVSSGFLCLLQQHCLPVWISLKPIATPCMSQFWLPDKVIPRSCTCICSRCAVLNGRQSLWLCPLPIRFIAMTGMWFTMGNSIPNGLFNCMMLEHQHTVSMMIFFFLNMCSFLEFIQTHVVRELSSIRMAGMIIPVLQFFFFFNFELFWTIGCVWC